jgi:hypothetical protein
MRQKPGEPVPTVAGVLAEEYVLPHYDYDYHAARGHGRIRG